MSIHFRCRHCAASSAIGTRKAGDKVPCPACSRVLTVPTASEGPGGGPSGLAPALAVGAGLALLALVAAGLSLPWLLAPTPADSPVALVPQAVAPEPAAAEAGLPVPSTAETAESPKAEEIAPPVPVPASPDRPGPREQEPAIPPAKSEPAAGPAAPPAKLAVKRHRDVPEEELLRQIEKVPEVMLDRTPDRADSKRAVALAMAAKAEGLRVEIGPLVMKQRPDLAGLPMIMGEDCHLAPSAADHLQAGSAALHAYVRRASRGGAGPDPNVLSRSLTADGEGNNKWLEPEAVPALQQILMAENEAVRALLVDQLAHIEGKRASLALAQRALFDLSADVRRDALAALAKRPAEEYRQALLDGLRHPWAPAADHAAEALATLELKDTVPTLLSFLDLPEPTEPYHKPGAEGLYVREMVKVNHLRNCLLCHVASLSGDGKVRGFVPPTTQPLTASPESGGGYGSSSEEGPFVRADVTYLRQDFSVPLPVANPAPWPAVQRFDFLVRERPATAAETHGRTARTAAPRAPSEHQKAIFFALRELTGKDPGPTAEGWKRLFLRGVRVTPS